MGFEGRIRERRFRALLDTFDAALDRGDRVAARRALADVRELRPDAREVRAAMERLLLLESGAAPDPASSSALIWARAFSAVALLVVGVSLLIGLDWLRRPPLAPVAPVAPPSAWSSPVLGPLHLELPEVIVDSPPRPRRAIAAKTPKPPNRVATAPADARPSGWGKVFKPTARFFTSTLPKALGIEIIREPARPGHRRSAI